MFYSWINNASIAFIISVHVDNFLLVQIQLKGNINFSSNGVVCGLSASVEGKTTKTLDRQVQTCDMLSLLIGFYNVVFPYSYSCLCYVLFVNRY